ncbi:phospholipase [Arthrobacter sp. H35-D1]|uniref:alpha/beta hydrolase n=1 Tax=Arthrobacter sp. H35-D1 TaxID=3046202 RepID=UPI0024BA1656|nr:phospholipase [Arthrobacter sp. H35-D1]MDJ0314238.1 phospholipase [Arthrobacter sp. H35-D1]
MNATPEVLWSLTEAERSGTPLLVILHGYGADEADLFSLAAQLPPEFTVASVRAPLQAGPGFAWFPLNNDLGYSVAAVTEAAGYLEKWLDGVRGEHSSVSLLGFSQGMGMATTLMRHRPADYAAVVGLSGFVADAAGDPFFDDAAVAALKPDIFWGRDQGDPVIPEAAIESTNTWMHGHVKLTKVLYTGIGHGINAQEIAHVGEFLQFKVLNGK